MEEPQGHTYQERNEGEIETKSGQKCFFLQTSTAVALVFSKFRKLWSTVKGKGEQLSV